MIKRFRIWNEASALGRSVLVQMCFKVKVLENKKFYKVSIKKFYKNSQSKLSQIWSKIS